MTNKIVNFIVGLFGGIVGSIFGKYLLIFLLSVMPILELRGGLIAAALLNMNPYTSLLVCLIGNILVIPFVLFFFEKVIEFLSKAKFFDKIFTWFKKKTLKHKNVIEKYGYLGILIFVAVPLPGSGAWTGCFLADLLGLNKKKSFFAALLGVVVAAIIMMIVSFGILKGIVN